VSSQNGNVALREKWSKRVRVSYNELALRAITLHNKGSKKQKLKQQTKAKAKTENKAKAKNNK
jgi:hypothetical protein